MPCLCKATVRRTGKPCLRETKDGLWYCGYHKNNKRPPPPLLECSICMNEITENEMVTTPCKHVFHTKCLEKWKDRSNTAPTCPNCRAVIGKAAPCDTNLSEPVWLIAKRLIETKQRRLCDRMRVLYGNLEDMHPNDVATRRRKQEVLEGWYDLKAGVLQAEFDILRYIRLRMIEMKQRRGIQTVALHEELQIVRNMRLTQWREQ